MKNLLILTIFYFIFTIILCSCTNTQNTSDLKYKKFYDYRESLLLEAKNTITKKDIIEFNNSIGKKMHLAKKRYLAWEKNFKKNIDNLANKNNKYIRLKEIINELYSTCITFDTEIDSNKAIALCDEGISIKNLSFLHYCKGFIYNSIGNFTNSIKEFNKVDNRTKALIPDAYRYIGMSKISSGDIYGGLKILTKGMDKQPSYHILADKMWLNYNLCNESTKEYINDKKNFLILLLMNEDHHNKSNYINTLLSN